jgi:SAM-dependent methyltransferase
VYSAGSPEALASTYDAWATTYDLDMLTIGYANPAVAAALVARHVREPDSRILDAGVGSGIVGELLKILGYRNLIGIDMSEGMLARARSRNAYAELRRQVLGETLDFEDGAFAAMVSFGVFTPGHAPAAAFDELVRITRPGGRLIFTVSTAAWLGGGFRERLQTLQQHGRIRAVEATDEYRPMPLSQTESTFTTRAYVYAVV